YEETVSVSGSLVQKIAIINKDCVSPNAFNSDLCNETILAFGSGNVTQNTMPTWNPISNNLNGSRTGRVAYLRQTDKNAANSDVYATDFTIASKGVVSEGATINLTKNLANYSAPAYAPDGKYMTYP